MGKLDLVLVQVLQEINPPEEELKVINETLGVFLEKIKKRIKKLKIDADIFVGGSFPKRTLIKKELYDVDLFLRYNKKYDEKDYTKLTKRILRFTKGVSVIHGSRDYFRVKISPAIFFEVVPVKKVKNPKEALNITDLSFFHVKYVKKKIKNKKIIDGIKLAKAFCHATRTYGAESYVKGFSGYSLELLIYYFKSFEKFLRELSKGGKDKIIIDIDRAYKGGNVLLDMNGSKLDSPVILVDPTYKARNVLAALSEETFKRFQVSARIFLLNPSAKSFECKKIDFLKLREKVKKKGYDFLKVELKTKKEKGDIAGTKLLKFFNHLSNEFGRYFEIKKKEFEYGRNQEGMGYFVLRSRKEIFFSGPSVKDTKNALKFRKEHWKVYERNGRLYAFKKINFSARDFLKRWVHKNRRKIKEMSISHVKGG